jgi:hypothetical protein
MLRLDRNSKNTEVDKTLHEDIRELGCHRHVQDADITDGQCYRIRRVVKNRFPAISSHFQKFKKIVENRKNSVEMQLTCEMNNKFLEIRNLAELTELSTEFADNSAEFFENSVTEYRPV